MRRFRGLIVVLLLVSVRFWAQEPARPVDLVMGYLNDSRLPGISDADLSLVVAEAKKTLALKFGTENLAFVNRGKLPIEGFFAKYLNRKDPFYTNYNRGRLKFFAPNDYAPLTPRILEFLKQWKVWDLADFFPAEKSELKTYEQVLPELMRVYFEKEAALEGLKLADGTWLVARRNNDHQSYINWMAAMRNQDQFDLVVCNTFIVYDDMAHPYPHAVTRFAKVGGSSFESPKRPTFDGMSSMVNIFEMMTDMEYFRTAGQREKISRETWSRVIGAYVLAHELGHMIYLIPDVYNHDKGCLMDSSQENLDYYEGYRLLQAYPEPCSKCVPYVDARNRRFSADSKAGKGDLAGAIDDYKVSMKMTPRNLDGDYKSLMGLIEYRIASCYLGLKDTVQAKEYCRRSLQDRAGDAEALKLLAELSKQP
jgi:tetratricopeptide (TPR) repeat protein